MELTRSGRMKAEMPSSIYFGGAAWGGAFYIGVYKGLEERWGPDFARKYNLNVSGDSAGVLWALGISLGYSSSELDTIYRRQSERAVREGQLMGRNSIYLRDTFDELIGGDERAYQKLEGRFSTATTSFPFEHRRHYSWTDNEDLAACVLGSLHVPLYCSRIKPYKGVHILDGAYSLCGTHLPDGDRTLFIGIDPNAEITRELTLMQMCFPCVGKEYDDMVESGYRAALEWDGQYKPKCGIRHANKQVLSILWPLKFIEMLITLVEDIVYLLCWSIWTILSAAVMAVRGAVSLPSLALTKVLSALLGVQIEAAIVTNLCYPLLFMAALTIIPLPERIKHSHLFENDMFAYSS
jgi:hypothetical protein